MFEIHLHQVIGALAIGNELLNGVTQRSPQKTAIKAVKIALCILLQNRLAVGLKTYYYNKERQYAFPSGRVMFVWQCCVARELKTFSGEPEAWMTVAWLYSAYRFWWTETHIQDVASGMVLGGALGVVWYKFI